MALPCIEMLAATPGILRGLTSEISDEDARWSPAPGRFSIAEVLAAINRGAFRELERGVAADVAAGKNVFA